MISCSCLHNDGKYYKEYAYTIYEFPYYDISDAAVKGNYAKEFMTFDIETTNVRKDDKKDAFMYHWQCCISGNVVFGRTWNEFITFLYQLEKAMHLSKEKKLVIYVHNLAFEFQFIYNFIIFKDVFATEAHKVLRCSNDLFEFRCSYMLSNMSLAKYIENSENTVHIKAKEDLDYRKIRTPGTQLTEKEYGYCFNDVMGLYEAVRASLQHDTLKSIPITSTGYVRRDARQAMKKNKKNRDNFLSWQIDKELYLLIKEIFRGGNTASSRYLAGQILEDVDSFDLSSAYPFCMVAFKYPTKFLPWEIRSIKELHELIEKDRAVIGRYRFENIEIKRQTPIAYIPFSKCTACDKNAVIYNGRILKADYIEISLTEIDLQIIEDEYNFQNIYISDAYVSVKRRLPKEFLDVIYTYFEAKSLLKGDPDKIYEYMKSKNKLNSLYGMIATDIIRDLVLFNNGVFDIEHADIDEAIKKYYRSRNSFLTYQHGMYVTAYTRMLLEKGFKAVGLDGAYGDTDSVKCVGDHRKDFERINQEIREYCRKNGIKHQIEVHGKVYEMGTFDHDAHYRRFKTLGAKKYCYENDDGSLHITVAGVNKKNGAAELAKRGGMEAFEEGFIFYDSGRTEATYNNEDIHYITVNGEKILTASNIAIFETTYELGITDTMREILAQYA